MALKIEYLPVGKLLRYAKNSRTHSDEQVEQLVNSIREFGFTNPVLIDEKNELIAG
ncbi:ParB N-terminal domain-containing protein, partial [Escherichia coli]